MRHLASGAFVAIVFTASVVVMGGLWSLASGMVGPEAATLFIGAVAAVFAGVSYLDWASERRR